MKGNYYKVEVENIGWAVDELRAVGENERADALLDMVAYDINEGIHYRVVSTLKEYFDFLDELWGLIVEHFNIEINADGRYIEIF